MNNNNVWNIDVNDEEYLHDNDIVGDFDFDEPIDCNELAATGERFPCDNCTCGFNKETVTNYVSKCGSCYLGDAYRCNGCPYLGKPPFNPNDEAPI